MTIQNSYLTIGDDNAPLKFEAFINLACPGSKKFYEVAMKILPTYIEDKKIQFIVKLYDKPREELLPGTLAHLCLEYDQPEKTLSIIKSLLETQSEWVELNDKEIKKLLITKYDLHEEEIEANTEISLAITAEAIKRDVKMVPSLFINNVKQNFTYEDIEAELKTFVERAVESLGTKA